MFWFFGCEVYRILVTQPGIEPAPPALEGEVLTTGPPGNSLQLLLTPMCYVLSGFSHVQLFVTSWTVAHQAPQSIGFSRLECWRGLPFPSGDLPNPGIELYLLCLLYWQAGSLPPAPPESPLIWVWKVWTGTQPIPNRAHFKCYY